MQLTYNDFNSTNTYVFVVQCGKLKRARYIERNKDRNAFQVKCHFPQRTKSLIVRYNFSEWNVKSSFQPYGFS